MNRGKLSSRAPDKGSFPLDHFHECDTQAKEYNECVSKHSLMPKRCRKYQVDYLNCRMNAGLMEKEEMDKLGMSDETSWESELQEKQYLYRKIENLKKKAWENVNKTNPQPEQKE